jgi:TatD DNase family protein
MIVPGPKDFIDIHNHDVIPKPGIFSIDNIMVHEARVPDKNSGLVYSTGIHPWFLTGANFDFLLEKIESYSKLPFVIAIGEAGFDKLKGPSIELQRKAFEAQVIIANKLGKPLFIHAVKAWDELLFEHKRLKPVTPWIVHGFQGKKTLAEQLLSKGMYLSLWAGFVMNRDSSAIIKSVPAKRLFLETDAFDVDIRNIYEKVSNVLQLTVSELKGIIYQNYLDVFGDIKENID